MTDNTLGGVLKVADDFVIHRMGYGAMQLAGPHVFGPPKDRDEAIAVLREAVESGVDHIDTADFYGPFVVNDLIKEALYPYPEHLRIVTKVGARRGDDGSWIFRREPEDLKLQVHENLRRLGLDHLDAVNFRIGTAEGTAPEPQFAEKFGVLAELQQEGLIRHLGLSSVTGAQLTEAQAIAPVVTVQNLYNLARRNDDTLVDRCAAEGIAFAAFFPLGGFTPLQSDTLGNVADRLGFTPHQVALAWLLHRSPTMVLIPGTSSRTHLRENLAAADLVLSPEVLAELDAIGA